MPDGMRAKRCYLMALDQFLFASFRYLSDEESNHYRFAIADALIPLPTQTASTENYYLGTECNIREGIRHFAIWHEQLYKNQI